jgi:hypothetical protein
MIKTLIPQNQLEESNEERLCIDCKMKKAMYVECRKRIAWWGAKLRH